MYNVHIYRGSLEGGWRLGWVVVFFFCPVMGNTYIQEGVCVCVSVCVCQFVCQGVCQCACQCVCVCVCVCERERECVC
jgi:hypothetical protein